MVAHVLGVVDHVLKHVYQRVKRFLHCLVLDELKHAIGRFIQLFERLLYLHIELQKEFFVLIHFFKIFKIKYLLLFTFISLY